MTFSSCRRRPKPPPPPPWVEFVGGPLHTLRIRAVDGDGWYNGLLPPALRWKDDLLRIAFDLPAELEWPVSRCLALFSRNAQREMERYRRVLASEALILYSWRP